jgi:hypothetical protein
VIDYASAMDFFQQAACKNGHAQEKLFQICHHKFEAALAAAPNSTQVLYQVSYIMHLDIIHQYDNDDWT